MRERLASYMKQALERSGCSSLDDVKRTLAARGIEMSPSTVARYWNGHLPTENKISSRKELQKIASLTDCPSEIIDSWNELIDYAREVRKVGSAVQIETSSKSIERWYQVISPRPGREFTTIDVVDLFVVERHEAGRPVGRLGANIRRVFPQVEGEIGLRWYAEGHANGAAYFFEFTPEGGMQSASSGTINISASGFRPLFYRGFYVRRNVSEDYPDPLVTRDLEWHSTLPTKHLPHVAILDLDNTLRSGWSIVSWVGSETMVGLVGADRLQRLIEEMHSSYLNNHISHDDFAAQSSIAYAEFISLNNLEAVQRAAKAYVSHELDRVLYSFAKPLIAALRRLHIAPILVTGAPQELAVEISQELNIEEVYSLVVENGTAINPGTADGKRRVVSAVSAAGRRLLLAAGDSDSDIPLMRLAPLRIVSPMLNQLLESDPTVEVFEFTEGTSASQMVAWLEANLRSSPFDLD